jgi:hypothetical protein
MNQPLFGLYAKQRRLCSSSRHHPMADQLQALAVMTDENYFLLLTWIVCALMFSCGVVALTHHPEWFGA